MSDATEFDETTIETLEGLQSHLAERTVEEPDTSAMGASMITLLLALPVVNWLAASEGSIVWGLLGGFGWWVLAFIGAVIVATVSEGIVGEEHALKAALPVNTVLAGAAWFYLYADAGLVYPLLLTAALPIAALLGHRSGRRERDEQVREGVIGLGEETLAAYAALPSSMTDPVREVLDRAIADARTIDQVIDNGLLNDSGQSVVALRGDVDRAMANLARKAVVADAAARRAASGAVVPSLDALRTLGDEIHRLCDAVLATADAVENGLPVELESQIESLRLVRAGQREIAREVEQS